MTVRPAKPFDITAIARLHVAAWRTTYRGIVPDSFLDQLSIEKHEQRHHRIMPQPGVVYFVADDPQAGIVGFISGGRERTGDVDFPGELYAIYILEQNHRRGIGTALVAHWAGAMLQMEFRSALVWVLAENKSAIEFYKSLGSIPLREQGLDIGGSSVREIAYDWKNLETLHGN